MKITQWKLNCVQSKYSKITMSVSDPLIKDIKGHTLRLFNEWQTCNKITDTNKDLLGFCETLEKIFYKGLVQSKNTDVDSWMFANDCFEQNFAYKSSVEEVKKNKTLRTCLGRFRLLVRHCLVKKCLHVPLESFTRVKKAEIFYVKNSIIGDEILMAILLSVLLQCSKINFQLDLNNYYFLDSTWQLPELVKLELVPCKNLGMSISFSDNKAVIVHIRPNSVSSEYVEISTGDILANLNGVEITSTCKGRLNSILRINKGRPVALAIIKAFYSKEPREIFPPMKNILSNLQIDVDNLKGSLQQIDNSLSETTKNAKAGYKATYLGFVDVGNKGSVKQIEEAMRIRLSTTGSETKEVIFEIGEMAVKIFNVENSDIILKHSYMQISSCGSAPNLPNYIAYIAGDENCDTASKFICHIFHLKSAEDAYTILQSIGQGFNRTHFAV